MATLIVETGSIVANANSYIDDGDLTTFASDYGFTVGADEPTRIQQTLKAMRYVETILLGRVQGHRVSDEQTLSFPRCGVIVDGVELADDSIPATLKNAVMQTVVEIQKGTPLWPAAVTEVSGVGAVKKKQIGPLNKEFHAPNRYGNASANPYEPILLAEVLQYLNPLMGGGVTSLTTRRA